MGREEERVIGISSRGDKCIIQIEYLSGIPLLCCCSLQSTLGALRLHFF